MTTWLLIAVLVAIAAAWFITPVPSRKLGEIAQRPVERASGTATSSPSVAGRCAISPNLPLNGRLHAEEMGVSGLGHLGAALESAASCAPDGKAAA